MARYPIYTDPLCARVLAWANFLCILFLIWCVLSTPLELLWHWLFPGHPFNS